MSSQCQGFFSQGFSRQGFFSQGLSSQGAANRRCWRQRVSGVALPQRSIRERLTGLSLAIPLSAGLVGLGLGAGPVLSQDVLPVPNVALPNGVVYYDTANMSRANYVVYVPDGSYDRWQRVLTVEPTAVIETVRGDRMIRAGSFNQIENARQRQRELAALGVPSNLHPSSVNQGGPADPVRAYYVVIPGPEADLTHYAWLARRLGIRSTLIQQNSQGPRGAHLAIGPYSSRREADAVEKRLQQGGLGNARLFFGRL